MIIIFVLLAWLAGCHAFYVPRYEWGDIFGVPVTCIYSQYELAGLWFGRVGE